MTRLYKVEGVRFWSHFNRISHQFIHIHSPMGNISSFSDFQQLFLLYGHALVIICIVYSISNMLNFHHGEVEPHLWSHFDLTPL